MSEAIKFKGYVFGTGSYAVDRFGPDTELVRTINLSVCDMSIAPELGDYHVTLTPVEPELRPCPFCGGEGWIPEQISTRPLYMGVKMICADCHCGTPLCSDRAEAIAAWNRRACDE